MRTPWQLISDFTLGWLGRSLILSTALGGLLKGDSQAADEKSWELSGYRVRITIAVDTSTRPLELTAETLARDLSRTIRANIYPLWSVELEIATGANHSQLLEGLDDLQTDDVAPHKGVLDKEMFLTLRSTVSGTQLACREFDVFTQRWSETLVKSIRQDRALSRSAFALICQTFAPLAVVRADLQDESQVNLLFKGDHLPRQSDEELFVATGDVYQPLLVRLSRTSGAPPDLIVDLPWTFVTVTERQEEGWNAAVLTGTRSPFGTRRRGRVETMALAVKRPLLETTVRFYATHDQELGLAGYEVFAQTPGETTYRSLGLTDEEGQVVVQRGIGPVEMLLLRSDGQLLAKVPVVPGNGQKTEIPIADDVARLLAQDELNAFKERLIDVVARRNILVARIRAQLKVGKLEGVDDFLEDLNALPDRARFDRQLTDVQNTAAHKSENPRVQQKIDRMIADARRLLGRFLSVSDVTDIEAEVALFKRQNSP